MEINRKEVTEWLATLSDREFAEVFYESNAKRVTSDTPEGHGHFILADTEAVESGGWDTDYIAIPEYQEGGTNLPMDSHICQSGRCKSCLTEIRSWVKSAVCPICAEKVHCS